MNSFNAEEVLLPKPDETMVGSLVSAFERAYTLHPQDRAAISVHVASFKSAPPEVQLAVWSKLTSQGIDQIDKAKWVHRHLAESVLSLFGVPMGEPGIGVLPKKLYVTHDEWSAPNYKSRTVLPATDDE